MSSDLWPRSEGVVEFPTGVRVRGRGLHHPVPPRALPDHGLLLLGQRPQPLPWPTDWIRWPDFRLPSDRSEAVRQLTRALERAEHERIEIVCRGGHGRTGTALAVMAVLAGVDRSQAVGWVRANYHPRAAEMPWQRRWVERLDAHL